MKHMKIGDHELAYERVGSGSPLVLIHGYPLDSSIWSEVTVHLQNKFDVIMPDLRGFGESALSAEYSMTDLADDITGLLNALGIESASIAGHSMGGYVALVFARKYPARINSLALIASQAPADNEERKAGRYKAAQDVSEQGVKIVADGMSAKLAPSPRVQERIHHLIGAQKPEALAAALKAMAGREDSTDVIENFSKLLLLIHDEKDDLIPFERAREMKALNSKAQLISISGVGHMPMLEKPDETAKYLRILE